MPVLHDRLLARSRVAAVSVFFLLPFATVGHAQGDQAAPGNRGAADAAAPSPEDAIPLTPDMIERLGNRVRGNQRARDQVQTELAAPISRRVNVSFAPGAATSIINTVKGYPSAISFFDSTGQPWPVAWDTNSNPAAASGGQGCATNAGGSGGPSAMAVGFFVCSPAKGSNTLEITPMSVAPRGGLVVSLEGAPKPVTFLLVAGGGRYDADLSIHVSDRGPRARVEIMTRPNVPETGSAYLTAMLQGAPPAEAVPLSARAETSFAAAASEARIVAEAELNKVREVALAIEGVKHQARATVQAARIDQEAALRQIVAECVPDLIEEIRKAVVIREQSWNRDRARTNLRVMGLWILGVFLAGFAASVCLQWTDSSIGYRCKTNLVSSDSRVFCQLSGPPLSSPAQSKSP